MHEIQLPPGVDREEVKQPDQPSYKKRASGELAPGDPLAKKIKAMQSLPSILITWDAEQQEVKTIFDPEQLKTWDLIAMLLAAALDEAKFNLNVLRSQQVMVRQQQAMMEQSIAKQVMGRR